MQEPPNHEAYFKTKAKRAYDSRLWTTRILGFASLFPIGFHAVRSDMTATGISVICTGLSALAYSFARSDKPQNCTTWLLDRSLERRLTVYVGSVFWCMGWLLNSPRIWTSGCAMLLNWAFKHTHVLNSFTFLPWLLM